MFYERWTTDNGTLIGSISELAKDMTILKDFGVTIGYHLEVKTLRLWWPSVD